jgi:hypothetical protein
VTFEEGQVRYDRDVASVDVPKTLRGIIASRVARLGPSERYLLQVASLVGERFQTDLVAAQEDVRLVSEALHSKEMRGIVSARGPTEHMFAHQLVQQVLTESITLQARKEIAREAGLAHEAALNAHNMGESYLRLGDHRRACAKCSTWRHSTATAIRSTTPRAACTCSTKAPRSSCHCSRNGRPDVAPRASARAACWSPRRLPVVVVLIGISTPSRSGSAHAAGGNRRRRRWASGHRPSRCRSLRGSHGPGAAGCHRLRSSMAVPATRPGLEWHASPWHRGRC